MELSLYKVIKRFFEKKDPDIFKNENEFNKQYDEYSDVFFSQGKETEIPISYESKDEYVYIYKYTALRADCIYQIVKKYKVLIDLFKCDCDTEKTIKIACLGGGPGSDLLGILKYIQNNIPQEDIKKLTLECHIFDKEPKWAACWDENDGFEEAFKKECSACEQIPVHFTVKYYELDLLVNDNIFQYYDLFTMSFVISEIPTQLKDTFIQMILNKIMKLYSIIVIVDINTPKSTITYPIHDEYFNFTVCDSENPWIPNISENEKYEDLGSYFQTAFKNKKFPQKQSNSNKNGMIYKVIQRIGEHIVLFTIRYP